MFKKVAVLFSLLLTFYITHAQLQSPEQFLGYKVGTRFTPHNRIVDYFRSVAAAVPSMVKLQEYGKTNEGRPLLLAYTSSAQNMGNLESIRAANINITRGTKPASVLPI